MHADTQGFTGRFESVNGTMEARPGRQSSTLILSCLTKIVLLLACSLTTEIHAGSVGVLCKLFCMST